ncbi:hypothetical protein HW132_25765 [Brasilonema sp. CT11]|nr:hypothetical protein [Brasilonema sp. CT11]
MTYHIEVCGYLRVLKPSFFVDDVVATASWYSEFLTKTSVVNKTSGKLSGSVDKPSINQVEDINTG